MLLRHFQSEHYENILSKQHCSATVKFSCGSAPIRLDTGGYDGLNIEERRCLGPFCIESMEDEIHELMQWSLYPDFIMLSDYEKTQVILTTHDLNIVKVATKLCSRIIERRGNLT